MPNKKRYASLGSLQAFKTNADNLYATKTELYETLKITAQTLTDEQKKQTRENIDAVSTEYVIGVFEELKVLISKLEIDEAIAVLDEAILDICLLA